MTTNASATLYHKTSAGHARHYIKRVMWQETRTADFSTGGKRAAESTRVFIPFEEYSGVISTGDYLVRGECPVDLQATGKVSDLTKNYVSLTLTSVIRCDYGSESMQHWEVIGK